MHTTQRRFSFHTNFHFVACLMAVLLLFACSGGDGDSGQVGDSCSNDTDCGDKMICNSLGQCITVQCKVDTDCQIDQQCNLTNHTCEQKTPVVDGDNPVDDFCQNDDDCPLGSECIVEGGYCQEIENFCTSNSDCGTGQYCGGDSRCHSRNEADIDFGNEYPDGDDWPPADDDQSVDGDQPIDGDVPDGDAEQADEDTGPALDSDNDGLPDYIEDSNHNGQHDMGETDLFNEDTDNDGLKDGTEDANHNGQWDPGETDPLNLDSDFDKLSDGVEDANHNGQRDPGETDPLNRDTDNDQVGDGDEVYGQYGQYFNSPSDPLLEDTDNDNLPDGVEDSNHNGIFEPDRGETDPTNPDTDGDGIPDDQESVNLICQEEQLTSVSLWDHAAADYTLALLPAFTYTDLELNPAGGTILYAAAFSDASNNIAGFILARDRSTTDVTNQVAADNQLMANLPSDGNLNHRGRTFTSYDEFPAMTSHYSITTTSQTVGALRNDWLAALSGRATSAIGNLPPGPSEASETFELVSETLIRTGTGSAVTIVIATVVAKDRYDNSNNTEARYRALDLTDGSALAKSQRDTFNGCDPHQGAEVGLVDFLWVVDDSGSMSEDQQAVANAAELFGTIMGSAGIDFRVAVTSTDCVDFCPPEIQLITPWLCSVLYPATNSGLLGDHKFTRNMTDFQSDVQDPPCGSTEYGLGAGMKAIERAKDPTLPENERWREDASVIVLFLSDEEDQQYEDCANATCEADTLTNYKAYYGDEGTTCFAIVGDTPDGCGGGTADSGPGAGEPGSAYIEIAYHTGGSFGSICAPDLTATMEEILYAAAGTASFYELNHHPISSTIQVMVEGQIISRSQTNGFMYDAIQETIVFYGTARPEEGDDVVVSYRFYNDDPKQ